MTLNCNSRSSRGATYEWYQNELNIALMNDPRMIRENNTLKILKTKLYHTGVYQCIETRKGREIQKQNRYVLLNVEGKCNRASITIKPYQGKKYPVGINLTLDCECKSSATKRIRWFRNGVRVKPKKKMITLDGKRLIFNNATYADSGNYTCMVTVDGFHPSWSRKLEFWVGTAPKIIFHKGGYMQLAPKGQKLKFPCRATGIPRPKITWYYMGDKYGPRVLTAKNDSDFRVYGDGSLEMMNYTAEMAFEFVCMARNVMGHAHINVDLSTPVKISVAEDIKAVDGGNLVAPCKALGTPKTESFWTDKKRVYLGNDGRVSSKKNGNLEVDGVRLGDQGRYYCTSARDDPSQDKETGVWLTVYETDTIRIKATHKNNTKAFVGMTITLLCEFESEPKVNITWSRRDMKKLPKRMESYGSSLNIHKVRLSDAGRYYCNGSNGFKSLRTFIDLLVYSSKLYRPSNVTVSEGDSAWLHCAAQADPPRITIAWFKKGQGSKMLDKKRFHIVANGSLHITNVQLGDQGKYFCMTSANKKQKYGTRYLFVREIPKRYTAGHKDFGGRFLVMIFALAIIYTL